MQTTKKNLFDKVAKLARTVKQDFKEKGLVVPVRLPNGNIQVGDFVIVKSKHQYFVRDKKDQNLVGPLNLAQTAAVIANDLALGRQVDLVLVRNDAWYGYRDFDEQVAINIAEHARKDKDYDRADFSQYKAQIAQEQKLQYKKSIELRYSKLCKLA